MQYYHLNTPCVSVCYPLLVHICVSSNCPSLFLLSFFCRLLSSIVMLLLLSAARRQNKLIQKQPNDSQQILHVKIQWFSNSGPTIKLLCEKMKNEEEATVNVITPSLCRSLVPTGLIMHSKANSNHSTT